ncbi:hypothetical protein [Cellvibrio japonicus]|uniref:Uncharacterized protein n=1 Tax=Cellvibrio japonicus (strain Ueda107) TaxID=498211 RepID=B3PI41_CELJU|nr:hypothetical protein [Cellvibrio japonicus]ACE83940.1 hypothetical protein CJA_0380 [Cellvibrio japonicus Ueda107]QEI11092.1 hypothetical protein FY117_01840 [Cellvibrio japonicus]QEI14666.1 hypothetical protein FY116_01840 [Cellvibrio japonicus]QEI18246.1 hypothetical protein FY115_01840 [Cellvibrio japonicus]
MSNNSIAKAIRILEGLLRGLDQAYWEANSLDRKDFFYDLISALHAELSELGKLSVQDHDLEYEPVTEEFRAARPKLSRLRKLVDDFALRSTTALSLEGLIDETRVLLGRHSPVL